MSMYFILNVYLESSLYFSLLNKFNKQFSEQFIKIKLKKIESLFKNIFPLNNIIQLYKFIIIIITLMVIILFFIL